MLALGQPGVCVSPHSPSPTTLLCLILPKDLPMACGSRAWAIFLLWTRVRTQREGEAQGMVLIQGWGDTALKAQYPLPPAHLAG